VICRNGKAVAELGPVKQRCGNRLKKHPEMSKIKINYDPTEELAGDEWGMIE
jgi:antitoxin (DNA-binding transcriptional repressor) of toxin-antitoxin stability system